MTTTWGLVPVGSKLDTSHALLLVLLFFSLPDTVSAEKCSDLVETHFRVIWVGKDLWRPPVQSPAPGQSTPELWYMAQGFTHPPVPAFEYPHAEGVLPYT